MNWFHKMNLFKKIIVGILGYALVWAFVFGACYLIDKAVNDAATGNILQAVKYAGYPLLGIGWALGWIVAGIVWALGQILIGAIWVIKVTFPYCLYFPGIPLALYALYRIVKHLASNPGPTQAQLAAEARYAENMRVVRSGMMLRTLSDMTKK